MYLRSGLDTDWGERIRLCGPGRTRLSRWQIFLSAIGSTTSLEPDQLIMPGKTGPGQDFNTWPTNSTVSLEYLSKYLVGSSYWSDSLAFPPTSRRFSLKLNLTQTGFFAREICPLAFCFRFQKCPSPLWSIPIKMSEPIKKNFRIEIFYTKMV